MKNILDYLERTTVCNAWKTAVDDGNICMTWLELQEMSKSIGTALCKRTGRQKPVVILAEKSAVTLAAMFGVVYAGCFYVMVDPKQPIERLCEIFHTLLPEIIIIPAENEALLEQTGYGECFEHAVDLSGGVPSREKLCHGGRPLIFVCDPGGSADEPLPG